MRACALEENFGYVKIGERVGRSSATAQKHVSIHNDSVEKAGFCMACKRAKSQYCDRFAERGQIQ